MCGISGSIVAHGRPLGATPEELAHLRDRMARRGPDGAGLWIEENAALAHRRLEVREPGPRGSQPMASADGRWVLVYNGELYNDPELRAELAGLGRHLWTRSDTETVVEALALWGPDAVQRLRGMYALAAWDRQEKRLVLARDPLGVKPLYWSRSGDTLVFGSDVRPVVEHPAVGASPDWHGISAYLTTLSSTRGERTLFEGVRMLEPGTTLVVETAGGRLAVATRRHHRGVPVDPSLTDTEAPGRLLDALADSVERQLVSDVPLCTLLSGGLDSVTIANLVLRHRTELRTYAAGSEAQRADLDMAREVAQQLGTDHAEAHVEREDFLRDWAWMVEEGGLPLSTPNEVAIHRVSRRLAADGCVVTLSGEGADELLAGYEPVMRAAERFEAAPPPGMCGGRFQLEATAWIPPARKATLLDPAVWASLENDEALISEVQESFALCREEAGPAAEGLDAHLRYLRRWNLRLLLERLDRATMLASVEGRVPFADSEVLDLCEALPAARKLGPEGGDLPPGKLVLRNAVRGLVPEPVLQRPKASFPLPFQDWVAGAASELATSSFAHELLDEHALETLLADPASRWQEVWPLVNLARWGDRWF